MAPYSASLDSLPWEQVDELLRKKVIDGEAMTVTRYSFSEGGRFPRHTHDQEQVTYVLNGAVTFVIDGKEHRLETGSLVLIPKNTVHSAEARDGGAEVLSVVTPARIHGRGITMAKEE